uniref:Uncharacterized protein n=1 Tax=Melopsittacus undulatus TaxID=13146 RepID=A0A8C6J0K6_MELUD
MFLFSAKHKTPISTYTDSYRPPYSVKHAVSDRRLLETWKENKFVTQSPGFSPSIVPKYLLMVGAAWGDPLLVSHNHQEPMLSPAPLDMTVCHFCIAEKYKPVFVNEDKYVSWRTSPSTTAWTMEPSYLPLLPKLTGWLLLVPLTFPYHPSASEKAVVADMMHRVPVYTVAGRIPFQSYYYPCSGRHCCLRGIDCYLDGIPITRKKLFALEGNVVRGPERSSVPVLIATSHPRSAGYLGGYSFSGALLHASCPSSLAYHL